MLSALNKKKRKAGEAQASTSTTAAAEKPAEKPTPKKAKPANTLDAFFSKKPSPPTDVAAAAAEEDKTLVVIEDSLPLVTDPACARNSSSSTTATTVVEVETIPPPAAVTTTESACAEDSVQVVEEESLLPSPLPPPSSKTGRKRIKPTTTAEAAASMPERGEASKKELDEAQTDALRAHIKANASKTKEELAKEFKLATTCALSERALAQRISQLAKKSKWEADEGKTWRLMEDIPQEEAAPTPKAKKQASPAAAAAVAVVELTDAEKEMVKSAGDLLITCKTLLGEIFAHVPVVAAPATSATTSNVSFAQDTPPAEVLPLIAHLVSQSRRTSKETLAGEICAQFHDASATEEQMAIAAAAWIHLVAKRVDYDEEEDLWALEMEPALAATAPRPVKQRLAWLKTLAACKRDLARIAAGVKKPEPVLKRLEERVTKVKREWFAANNTDALTPGKKKPSSAETPPHSAASVPAPQPKVNALLRFGFSTTPAPAPVAQEMTTTAAVPVEIPETSVQVLDEPAPSKRHRSRHHRIAFLFLDSRVKMLRFDRKQQPEYFGIGNCVTRRQPFKLNAALDYEVDSEDEDGESLSGGDKEDLEDAGEDDLDFTDRWLAPEDDPNALLASKAIECKGRIVSNMTGSLLPPLLSMRNQPFEVQSESPDLALAGFTLTIHRKRGEITSSTTNAAATTTPPPHKKIKAVSDDQLREFVALVEGSTLKKDEVMQSFFNKLAESSDAPVPSKLQLVKRFGEIAIKLNKRWFVRSTVLAQVGLVRSAENRAELQAWATKKKMDMADEEAVELDLFTKKQQQQQPAPTTPATPAAAAAAAEPTVSV